MPQALIIGDSQAQACSAALSSRLKSDGYLIAGIFAKHGIGSIEILTQANLAKSKCPNPDLVIVFSGSVEGNIRAGSGIPALFPNSKIIWYGSSPATKILNISLAKKVFTNKVDGDDYWFSSSESTNREARNKKLKQFFSKTKVVYVDYRDLTFTNDVLQSSKVMFPDLQDGIHITASVAKEMFSPKNYPPKIQVVDSTILGIKKSVLAIAVITGITTIGLLYKFSKNK